MTRAGRAAIAALAVAALVTACGGGGSGESQPSAAESGSPSASTPGADPVWPMSGLPTGDADPGGAVLVVKVDNTAAARPQVGLSSADLIVEQLVEGGMTRLAAFYHSTFPAVVGPVRSVRTTDIAIVAPTGGALAASGGAGRVVRAIADAGQVLLDMGDDPGFSRADDREAPYNVMVDPARAIGASTKVRPPDGPYLPWGPGSVEGAAVTEVDTAFSASHTTRWTWHDGVWARQDSLAGDGDDFGATTLLILRVTTRDAGYEDPAGNPVPETVLEGTGEASILHGGVMAPARWAKAGPDAPITLTDPDGEPMTVPAGRTWIALVPEAGSVVTR